MNELIQLIPIESAALRLTKGGRTLAEIRVEAGSGKNDLLAANPSLRAVVRVEPVPGHAGAFFAQWSLENAGEQAIAFDRLSSPIVRLDPGAFPHDGELWTMQGAAVHWGQDFAFRLPKNFERQNFLGHIDRGEGGGIPQAYVWNRETGVALSHVETTPRDWYMPVHSDGRGVRMAFERRGEMTLRPGEKCTGLRVMISAHSGDFFEPLALYRDVMTGQGLVPAAVNAEDYEPAWCSWGYEFDVRPSEMIGALPKVRELDLRWLTLDDRWFDDYGQWMPRADTFPGGGAEMRAMVDAIHAAGAYAQIWWYPLSVEDGQWGWDDGSYHVSPLLDQHSDWLILNPDGTRARNNRSLAIACPAVPEVQEYIRETTLRFIDEWDYDGHKLDNIYTVPACHNPAHHHARPEESTEALAEVYRIIFEETRRLKPHAVTQICPCGTPVTFSLLPYMDQSVTADPTSSQQIRQRIKFYKALTGPRAAVFADHVELSDGGRDFASEIGAGGVPATKFIWPADEAVKARLKEVYCDLPPAREALWKRWFAIYRQVRLAEAEYVNLYDLAFDRPETHAIRKDGRMYFAFYADQADATYQGAVTFRGLGEETYVVYDYVHDREVGTVRGPEAVMQVTFEGSLLVEVTPL
jgi:alpha-galactosidase